MSRTLARRNLRLAAFLLAACSGGTEAPSAFPVAPASSRRLDGAAVVKAKGKSERTTEGGLQTSGAGSSPGDTTRASGRPAPSVASHAAADRSPSGDVVPRFPPADIPPPFAASAHAGDGKWRPLGDASRGDRAGALPVMVTTTLHPHKVSRFDSVTLVAVDLTRVSLHLVPGASDISSQYAGPAAGLIAETHQGRALAVFNGGFKARHGRWGFVVGSDVITAPRTGGCTFQKHADGALSIAASTDAVPKDLRWLRQTPPCLLLGGELHPLLKAKNERPWGGFDWGEKTRRRSAVGLDSTRSLLFYALAVEAGPELLARGLAYAGAVEAAELDINYYWTRFLLIGDRNGKPELTSALAAGMVHGKHDYLQRPGARDFFYLVADDGTGAGGKSVALRGQPPAASAPK